MKCSDMRSTDGVFKRPTHETQAATEPGANEAGLFLDIDGMAQFAELEWIQIARHIKI